MINLAVQALGLLSVVLLAVPALHAARYARLLSRLHRIPRSRGTVGQAAIEQARASLQAQRDSWTRLKGFCLLAGTLCAGLSYALAFAVALSEWLVKTPPAAAA